MGIKPLFVWEKYASIRMHTIRMHTNRHVKEKHADGNFCCEKYQTHIQMLKSENRVGHKMGNTFLNKNEIQN